ncbi:MAG: heme NO-binding domain-containing protein [bacterium]
MKQEVTQCLTELVREKFGQDKWEDALEKAGLNRNLQCIDTSVIDDEDIINVIRALCNVLNLSIFQLADRFEEYWITNYISDNFSNCQSSTVT